MGEWQGGSTGIFEWWIVPNRRPGDMHCHNADQTFHVIEGERGALLAAAPLALGSRSSY